MSGRRRAQNETEAQATDGPDAGPSAVSVREILAQCMDRDRFVINRKLRGAKRRGRGGGPRRGELERLEKQARRSADLRRAREHAIPKIHYPEDLPVSGKRSEIADAIAHNKVVVVCGETGSGKTTQLPKICLELGRGVGAMIAHTQPRRIAARSVARRIADELGVPMGQGVGAKVRFTDNTSDRTWIKLLTDGMLLAETQGDRQLRQYDTIIIDEAHERSLNIDFLLGYLRSVVERRSDLKVIVTSATIDPERFAEHFAPAAGDVPIIEVSGRTYPVDVRYRPLEVETVQDEEGGEVSTEEIELIDGVVAAIDEAEREDARGHVLVFMPGEREIRDTADALHDHFKRRRTQAEVLPLYARLSHADQQKIFAPTDTRRIVISTNVAETSLTVPGIRFVVDPGLARMSRYSARSKVQRLPIEAISRASADQRKGRCGRIGPGICFRLYSEEDYDARPEFTDPEILRTNLASVILQMLALGLGDIESFPFLEKPDRRQVRDGLDTLRELGAIDDRHELTEVGRELAKLPVDPRLGRMLLAADDEGCLEDVMVIVAGLAVPDARLRPAGKEHEADVAHERFADEQSDFLALTNMWKWYRGMRGKLSNRKIQQACHQQFISHLRMREWQDVHRQLVELVEETGRKVKGRRGDADQIHRALLAGLLSNVGHRTNKVDYNAPHGVTFNLFPGSGLFKEKPDWVMAAEVVRTERTYARMVASIQPKWIEKVGAHLVSRRYSDPRWSNKRGRVLATEHVSLFGLPIHVRHNADYTKVNAAESRELFIHHALVEQDYGGEPEFLAHNRAMIAQVEQMEDKARRRDIVVDKSVQFAFYDERIPRDVLHREAFEGWFASEVKREPMLLRMTEEDLTDPASDPFPAEKYPDTWQGEGTQLPLSYKHTPGERSDGVTMTVPLEVLPRLDERRSEWLVPGLRAEKIEAMLRALPKPLRRQFVPLKETSQRVAAALVDSRAAGSFRDAVKDELERLSGIPIPADALDGAALPEHLRMNFRVLDGSGEVVEEGRDLPEIREKLSPQVRTRLSDLADEAYRRDGIVHWDFGDLEESVEIEREGAKVVGYPALVDRGDSVSLRLVGSRALAEHATIRGLRRLFLLEVGREVQYQIENLPGADRVLMYGATMRDREGKGLAAGQVADQIAALAVEYSFLRGELLVRTREEFRARLDRGWHTIGASSAEAMDLAGRALGARHAVLLELENKSLQKYEWLVRDVGAQVRAMCPPRFLVGTPSEWLRHVPRYLSGALMRLRKIRHETAERDRQQTVEIQRFEQMYNARLRAGGEGAMLSPELMRFRWMIEEFRVSVFAQELGTSAPVSSKRLMKLYESLGSGGGG